MAEKKQHIIPGIIIPALFFTGCLLFFGFFYNYHLFFTEQLQVFLLTFDHFTVYLSKPAFLASYIGDFLTQFYYLKWGGAVIITGTLIMLWFVLKVTLNKITGRRVSFLWPLVPVILSWIALCDLEYPVSNIIALMISVTITLIYISIRSSKARFAAGFILTPLLYVLAGSSFYILAIIGICYEISQRSRPGMFLNSSFLAILAIFVPPVLRSQYLLTTAQSYAYLSEMTRNPVIWQFFPIIGILVIISLMVLFNRKKEGEMHSIILLSIEFLVLSGLLVSGILLHSDFMMEKILRLDYESSRGRWQEVRKLADKYHMHNNFSAYFSNMALAKLGHLPDELMNHYQPIATGLFIPVNANENYLTITLSNEVYWQLGDVNASQHSALLGSIFSPRSNNSRLMERLIEINIVNGQYAPAEKYISILEKTMFHRKWAEGMRKYLFNESECSKAEWITRKRAIIPSRDLLKKGNEYIETLRMLTDNHPGNRMAVDYLLCYHLLCKDIEGFAGDFDKYFRKESYEILPKVYQEGLMILFAKGERKPENYRSYRFLPATFKAMKEYTDLYAGGTRNRMQLYEKFGKTYWFYYHFATMKTE
jgi:hypothetical protein